MTITMNSSAAAMITRDDYETTPTTAKRLLFRSPPQLHLRSFGWAVFTSGFFLKFFFMSIVSLLSSLTVLLG